MLLFSTLISLWGLGGGPWLSDHEAIVAQGARQILGGDGWMIPHLGETPFVRKPPLAFWLAAGSSIVVDPDSRVPPVSSFSARLPSGCAAVLTTLLIYLLGRHMFGHPVGLICGLIMTTAVGTLFFSHNAQIDMTLTFLCTACFASFWFATEGGHLRNLFLSLFYVSLALTMLAKAPFPLGVVGLPLAAWWFVTLPALDSKNAGTQPALRTFLPAVKRQLFRLRELHPVLGILIFVSIVLPWPLYVYRHVPNVLELWDLEFTARYTGDLYGTNNPFWYYILVAAGFMAPYSLSLPASLVSPFRSVHQHEQRPLLFAFTWVVVATVFMSTSAFKVPRYWVVCVPGAALLLGPTIYRMFVAAREFSAVTMRISKGILLTLLFVGTIGAIIWASRNQDQAMLSVFWVVGLIALIGCVAATVSFQPGRRLLSLFVLQSTVAIAFALGWDTLGLTNASQRKFEDLVAGLNAHAVKQEDRITWIQGRPDARLIFYSGRNVVPLFNDSELAELRDGRQGVPELLMTEAIDRIHERLAGDTREYFVIESGWWDRLRDSQALPAREVFRVRGSRNSGRDGLVVFTNSWNGVLLDDLKNFPLEQLAAGASERSNDRSLGFWKFAQTACGSWRPG